MNIREGAPMERREQEGALTEQIKDAFRELEADLRETERLAAAAAEAKRKNPAETDFGFQDDLTEAINAAKVKFEDLVARMIERGTARGEAVGDPNQDLFS